MRRRRFCHLLMWAPIVVPRTSLAAESRSTRVAWVSVERAKSDSPYLAAFRDGMRELGYREGVDIVIDGWWGDGTEAKLRQQADAIVASRPTVLVAQGGIALSAMRDAKVALPIVFGISAEPVEAGVAKSFARPGGNATGMSFFALDLVPKRMQLMREMLPRIQRVAVLADPEHPGQSKEFDAASRAAAQLGLLVRNFPVHTESALESALTQIARERDDAILAFADGFTLGFAERIARFSLEHRIPAVDGWAPFARQGNLMTYGPVLEECYRRLATYVDRIVKGAKPGELPIELPSKVELVVNLQTARGLGLTIPQSVLLRANQVIG